MVFVVYFKFISAQSGDPIYGLPITITWQYDNANCFGSVNKYTPVHKTTNSSGMVSQSFGSGSCGADVINASTIGNRSYYPAGTTVSVGVNRGGSTTYIINVEPIPKTTTYIKGSTIITTTQSTTTTFATTLHQKSTTFTSTLTNEFNAIGKTFQSDFEIIAVIGALVAVAVILIFVIKLKTGGIK